MSNYRNHAIAGILFALPFAPSLFYLFFALLGASIPDMDHVNNKNKVVVMFIIGVILAVALSVYDKLPLSAMIIILVAGIFYVSKHRGFTHTLLGVSVLSFLFTLIVMGFIPFINKLLIVSNIAWPSSILLFVVMILVGYFIVSRKYLLWYVLLVGIYLILFPVDYGNIGSSNVFLMFFIGAISHIILDLWTPAGLCLFIPVSYKKYHRSMALLLILIWIICSLHYITVNGSLLTNFTSIFKYA